MATVDTKPKAGDLVLLRRSQAGSSAGLHWVVEVVEGGIVVEQLSSWPQRFTAPLEDVVRTFRGLGDAAEVTLAPRPEAKLEPAQPLPDTAQRLIKVHVINVINASKDGYEITRPSPLRSLLNRRDQVSTRYLATRVVFVDESKQSHSEFLVDSRDVGKFLVGVQGSYLSDKGLPVRSPHARDPQFSEDS
jgi:hypothetical protein